MGFGVVAVSGLVSSSVLEKNEDGDGDGLNRGILGEDLSNTDNNTSGMNAVAVPSDNL